MTCCMKTPGVGPDYPVLLGEANGEPPVRARVTLPLFGLAPAQTAWFTGADVQAWADTGALVIG